MKDIKDSIEGESTHMVENLVCKGNNLLLRSTVRIILVTLPGWVETSIQEKKNGTESWISECMAHCKGNVWWNLCYVHICALSCVGKFISDQRPCSKPLKGL